MRLNVRLYCYSVNSAKYLSIGLYQFRASMVFRCRSVRYESSKKYGYLNTKGNRNKIRKTQLIQTYHIKYLRKALIRFKKYQIFISNYIKWIRTSLHCSSDKKIEKKLYIYSKHKSMSYETIFYIQGTPATQSHLQNKSYYDKSTNQPCCTTEYRMVPHLQPF